MSHPSEEVAWRCVECGKWSHAKRRPKFHKRFTPDEPATDAEILEHDPGSYDHMNGFTVEPGWWIKCGPFDRYRLTRDGIDG